MAARFGFSEDTVRLAAALRPALAARGVPEQRLRRQRHRVRRLLAAAGLRRAWASSSSTPPRAGRRAAARSNGSSAPSASSSWSRLDRRPASRGDQPALAELNRLFTAWVRNASTTAGPLRDRGGAAGAAGSDGVDRSRCRCRPRPSCARRSCGASAAPSPRPPRSPCTATSTRSTRSWPAAGRAGLRPVRPDRHRGPLQGRPLRRQGHRRSRIGRHAHPKARPEQPGQPAAARDRDRLPARLHRAPPTTRRRSAAADQLSPPCSAPASEPATLSPGQLPGQMTIDRGPRRPRGGTSEHREAPGPLRIHPDAVRPRPGPRHAAPPRRPRRGRRPDQLVHQPSTPSA